MYSSSTKNWFHTQPLLTLWNPLEPPFLPAAGDGPAVWLWGHSCPVLLWKGAQELCSKRKHRNSSRQFLLSIGRSVTALFPRQGPEEKGEVRDKRSRAPRLTSWSGKPVGTEERSGVWGSTTPLAVDVTQVNRTGPGQEAEGRRETNPYGWSLSPRETSGRLD
ncbi:hypothetical protein Q8A67_020252 [Cirrhinus molitorella]|uniref:Uncharacterized protein n=1 Tax=Cirrhinus molitorella TaxID=172907 RepID=A0AA88TGT2_9TELE|nr:hypothetical protein Q8A67_020252 [Cirrhinus molitorella]